MRLMLRTFVMVLSALLAASQARADVCVTLDEAHDNLAPQDRGAAVLLLARQFEIAGEHVVDPGCTNAYALSHIRLGTTIEVTLAGPGGERRGTALGLQDLPALYNQMVRSIVTGRPMEGFNVIDRTNVTAAQASAERVGTDGFWYARLGYGSLFGDKTYGTPSFGMGYRVELDKFGIDVSFFNYQVKSASSYYYTASDNVFAGSLLKLEGLYFLNPTANKSTYLGGGLSWGGTRFGGGPTSSAWNGTGLSGELTAGYELPRASTLRAFVQADAILPFYRTTSVTYPIDYRRPSAGTTAERYSPSLVVSIGLGWQRARHGRQ